MSDPLARIAAALERLAPPPPPPVDLTAARALLWRDGGLATVAFRPLALALLTGIDEQQRGVLANLRRHAAGHAAHDMLLWGARGSGKSALVKAAVGAVQEEGGTLLLVEASGDALATLPQLFDRLAASKRPTLVFVDDLGFEEVAAARTLRSLLEGGASARPPHVRLAVTSNRRHLVHRDHVTDAVHPRDALDDELALADRFGLSLGFHVPDQATWLAMVDRYAQAFQLPYDPADALRFANARGGRSGRVAWHYAVELAGAAGRALP